MKRVRICRPLRCFFALTALVLCVTLSAEAQQAKKVHRIGYLVNGDAASESTRSEAIRQGLRELGYVEGQNIATEYRYAEGKRDRFPELAAELIRLKVEVIVVSATSAALAAKKATSTIPIVMASVGDPVEQGIVTSLARPGGNITGFVGSGPGLAGKRFEILKEVVPRSTRVGLLTGGRPLGRGAQMQVKERP